MSLANTLVVKVPLGTAASFDQKDFPLEYYGQEGNFNKGSFLIKATLEEMEKIKELRIDLSRNQDFIYDTRLDVEDLKAQREKLRDNRKTLNPIKAFQNYRTARLFHAASKNLYRRTMSTSEKIHRDAGEAGDQRVRVVPSTQMQAVNDAAPPGAWIDGFCIELSDGELLETQRRINDVKEMLNPFIDDPVISQLRDGEQIISLADTASLLSQDARVSGADEGIRTSVISRDPQGSRPTSPQTVNHIHYHIIQNSIVTTNSSNLTGITANHGERNSGASVTQEFTP